VPVLVEHDIARHQHSRFGEIGNHGIGISAGICGSMGATAVIIGNYRNIPRENANLQKTAASKFGA